MTSARWSGVVGIRLTDVETELMGRLATSAASSAYTFSFFARGVLDWLPAHGVGAGPNDFFTG
jgi:hypothetical protein